MHRLDDDYGVIDHNGYGQHECEKRKKVKREPCYFQEEESTYQRYDYRYGRDQRRAEVLKEHVNHDEHEDECFDDGFNNLVYRGV